MPRGKGPSRVKEGPVGTSDGSIFVTNHESLISARPGYRLRTGLIALISLRTVGELIHGYAYGDSDWEEAGKDEDEKCRN